MHGLKSVLVASVLVSLLATPAVGQTRRAETWRFAFVSDHTEMLFDVDSIRDTDSGRIVRSAFVFPKLDREIAYVYTTTEIRCSEDKLWTKAYTAYNERGGMVNSSEPPSNFVTPPPGSYGKILMEIVCRGNGGDLATEYRNRRYSSIPQYVEMLRGFRNLEEGAEIVLEAYLK